MNKNFILLPVVSLFLLSSCQFWPHKVTQEIPFHPLTAFDESVKLEFDHIANLRLHGYTQQGSKSIYFKEKESIIAAYNGGDRSQNILRAYIYLTTLEADFETKAKLEKELCDTYPDTCHASLVKVNVSGAVHNSLGKALSWVTIEVLGTSSSTKTDVKWKYSIDLDAQSPSIIRLRASSDSAMIGVKKIELVDSLRSLQVQKFETNFTLITPFETAQIDTSKQTITGKDTSKTGAGYLITTPYTKYTIPFNTIVKDGVPYQGKLKAMVFEFDRSSGSFLLDADAFDGIEGFASQLFVTYGMPFIIFTADDGSRLDVMSTNPMYLATTKRESDERTKNPKFQELYTVAFNESQKVPGAYPINSKWLFDHGNLQILPAFWVFDRSTGFWDNVGMRFASDNPDAPYNVESPFYTIFVGKR